MTSISFERRVCCYAKLFVRSRGGSRSLRRQECRRPSCGQFPIYVVAWLPLRQVNYTKFSWRCDELSIASARDARRIGYDADDTSSSANTVPRYGNAAKRTVSRRFDFRGGQRLCSWLVKVDQPISRTSPWQQDFRLRTITSPTSEAPRSRPDSLNSRLLPDERPRPFQTGRQG